MQVVEDAGPGTVSLSWPPLHSCSPPGPPTAWIALLAAGKARHCGLGGQFNTWLELNVNRDSRWTWE